MTNRACGLWTSGCALLAGTALAASFALAQGAATYPRKPVRFVCVTAPGGGLDVVGRMVADRLSRKLT